MNILFSFSPQIIPQETPKKSHHKIYFTDIPSSRSTTFFYSVTKKIIGYHIYVTLTQLLQMPVDYGWSFPLNVANQAYTVSQKSAIGEQCFVHLPSTVY